MRETSVRPSVRPLATFVSVAIRLNCHSPLPLCLVWLLLLWLLLCIAGTVAVAVRVPPISLQLSARIAHSRPTKQPANEPTESDLLPSHAYSRSTGPIHPPQYRIKPNDGLPQRICPKCTAQFYIIHKFRRKCLKVQIRLRALHEVRCLEEEQHQLLHEKESDLDLNVPPALDIGNDLISDNYGQPLSEVDLFESAAWNATDAPLLDNDASKIDPQPEPEVEVETEAETELEKTVDSAVELNMGTVDEEHINEDIVLELEAQQSVRADELIARAATIDEEALLATHVIFKPVNVLMNRVGASSEAPKSIMQSEEEPLLDKLENECFEAADEGDTDTLGEEVDYYEETIIERCDNELDETTIEPASELEPLDTLSNVDLFTTHENSLKEETTESITSAFYLLQTAENEIQPESTKETPQSYGMEVEYETMTTPNVGDKPNITAEQVNIESDGDILVNELNSSKTSVEIKEDTAVYSEQPVSLSTEVGSIAEPSDNRQVSHDKSVASISTSTTMKSTEPPESVIVTKAALKAYGSPRKSRPLYRVQRSFRRSLNWPMARLSRLSSSTPNSSTLSPLTVACGEMAMRPLGELNAIAASSSMTQAASLSANVSSVPQTLSAADANAQTQETANPPLPEVSRAIFSSYSTAKRGRRPKWRARATLAVGAHKRKPVVSEHAAAKPQIPTCFVRLRRLHMDRWVCETDVIEVSTAATTRETRDIWENESHNVRQDLSRKADNTDSAVFDVSESAPLGKERSRKRFRKQKNGLESKYTQMAARSSPWRTKAEMKENITEESKMLTDISKHENAITAEECSASVEGRLADAAERTLDVEQIKAVDNSETEPIVKNTKRGRKPKLGVAKVSKIVTHRKRFRRKKELQIVERRSKRIRKRLKRRYQMGDSADESSCSDKSDMLPKVFATTLHAAAMKPPSADTLKATTIEDRKNETPAAEPDKADISRTHELLKITQCIITQVKADHTPPISTQVQAMAHSAHIQSEISTPKENRGTANDSATPMYSVSSTEGLLPTTKSENETLPTALIVRISLASLSADFQRIHLPQPIYEYPNSRSANLLPASDTVNQQNNCSNILEQQHITETESKSYISAAADCSDAVTKNSATVADNIATAEPAVSEPYIAKPHVANAPSHGLDNSSASAVSPTDAADVALVTEHEHSHCSQQDSEQSDFLGFTHESDSSREQLNASTASSESRESIETQRAVALNTSMNASSKIHDFINDFQTHCIDPSEVEADEEEEQMYQQQQRAAMSALHMAGGKTLSLSQQRQQQSGMQLLSESNLSEMQDVETTLSGILNEMQDQHIYTPVSSHTDDFFTQSVYSPLSDPPGTPTHSIYVESPMDGGGSVSISGASGGLSVESSPYAPHTAGVQTAETAAVAQKAGENAFSKNFPTYGECFTEDSTQSELIGFQNDIPCFENIEMAAAATSMATTTPTTIAVSSPNSRLNSGRTIITNSALKGAPPKCATETNIQYLGMAHDSDISNVAANGMGLVCTTGSGVQVHAPAFQVSSVATSTVAQMQNGHGRGVSVAYVDDSEKEYAVDSATLQLAQLLNDLQPPQQQQQQQPLVNLNESTSLIVTDGNTPLAATKSIPIQRNTHGVHKMSRNSSSNAKVQYVTLTTGNSVSEPQHIQLSDINSLRMSGMGPSRVNVYNSTSVGPHEIQWTTSNGDTVTATATHALGDQAGATTTTYYINASDLYQSNLITTTSTQAAMVTAPTLDTVTVSTLPHAPQQPMELDKSSMDANENYIDGLQQQQQQQPIMIVIPHEFMRTDASASTATAGATQIYNANTSNSTASGNASQDLSHSMIIAQTPQTVLVQQPTQLALPARSGANMNDKNNIAKLTMNTQYLTTSTVVASPSRHSNRAPAPQHRQPQQNHHLATVTSPPPQCHPRHNTSTTSQASQQPQKQQSATQPQEKVNLTCRFCHKRPKFTSNLDYSNHIIAVHPVETPFNCPLCPMHFTRRVKRQQHIVEEHGAHRFQCAQCGQSFSTQRALDLHLQRSHAPESSQQQQQQQQQKEQQSQALLQAQQRYLAHRNAWADGSSGAKLSSNHAQTQMVRVEDVRLYVSDEDNKDKKSIDLQLGNGTESSTNSQTGKQQRILCCPDCDDPFDETHVHSHPPSRAQQQPEEQHQQQKSLHVTLPSPEQTEPDSTSTTTLRHFRKRRTSNAKLAANVTAVATSNCSSSSASAAALTADGAASAEDELLLMERVLRTSHNCLFCTERFTNEISLRKHHLLSHSSQTTMPFVCSTCKRGFRMRTALQRHMETHDSEGRPFECTLCHVRFPRPSQLTLHKLTVHFLKKPHTCEECGKQFGTESALKTHAKFHGERDVECDMCSRKFFLMKDMRKHRRVHIAERFYKCDLCPSSFLHYTRLSAHLKTHLPLNVYLPQDSSPQPQMQQQQRAITATVPINAESAQQVQQSQEQQQQPELALASACTVISTTAAGSVISTP